MRTAIKQTSLTQAEIWRGPRLLATIYATPAGVTIQADGLEPSHVDIDESTVHIELRGE
jgi:hypothetical protein